MNDDSLRERARERLASAELAAVLAVPITALQDAGRTTRRASWLAAAVVLVGMCVAAGVAWLRQQEPVVQVQEPAKFDPVNPSYEQDITLPWPSRTVRAPADLDGIAAAEDAFTVRTAGGESPELVAVTERANVRVLMVSWRSRKSEPLGAAVWRRIGAMPNLEMLALAGGPALRADELRELRRLPRLRTLMIVSPATVLDRALGQALVELPKLAMLMLAGPEVTADGLTALSGLPHLDALLLSGGPSQLELSAESIASLRQLRQLRALFLEGRARLSGEQMRTLAALPRLQVLQFYHLPLADDSLEQLPARLESLRLSSLDRVTTAGLLSLVRLRNLRSLAFSAAVPAALDASVAELIGKLPLENYESLVQLPSPAIWQALQDLPNLRGITMRRQGSKGVSEAIAECAKLPRLERLNLIIHSVPDPADFEPLRSHATLRHVHLRLEHLQAGQQPTPEQLAALRTCLGAEIEVVVVTR